MKQDALNGTPDLKAMYSLGELSKMSGVNRHTLRRILTSNGVILRKSGRNYHVALVSLQEQIPDLWESTILKTQLEEL